MDEIKAAFDAVQVQIERIRAECVQNVITSQEAEALLGQKDGSVSAACRRGVYKTARKAGGVWLLHRDEVEARLTD